MANDDDDVGYFLKKSKGIQSKNDEGRERIQKIKELINSLNKAGTGSGKNEKSFDGSGGAGGSRGGNNKTDRDQNSIRLIFSAIKNKFSENIPDKIEKETMNGKKNEMIVHPVHFLHNDNNNNSNNSSNDNSNSNANEPNDGDNNDDNHHHHHHNYHHENSTSSPVPYVTLKDEQEQGKTGNVTSYERNSEVLLDDVDIVESPLSENTFFNFLNGSLDADEGKNYGYGTGNRTYIDKNDTFNTNFDFFTSSSSSSSTFNNYNNAAAEFLTEVGGRTNNLTNFFFNFDDETEKFLNKTNVTLDWDVQKNSSWDHQPTPMAGNFFLFSF